MNHHIKFLVIFLTLCYSCKKSTDFPQGKDEEIKDVVYVSSDETVNICSLNIRYSNTIDGVNNWVNRKQWLADFINYFEIDIIGMQEEKNDQVSDLHSLLSPDYDMVGKASSDKPGYEYCGIYFRKDRVELVDWGRFWLSETPDQESIGWDALYHRQVTWAKFKQLFSGKEFFVFNTHFSHVDDITRQNSAKLLKNKIKSIAGDFAVMVTGDFNTWPDTQTYNILTQDSEPGEVLTETRKMVPHPYSANYTGHCFGECYQDGKIVDYVFVNDKVDVEKYGILTEQRINVFLSDHYPVLATLLLK